MTTSADPVRAKAERMYSQVSTYRIGSRIVLDGLEPHTLVALRLEGGGDVFPFYVGDDCVSGLNSQFGVLDRDDLEEGFLPAPDDPEKVRAARAWAANNREYLTHHGHDYVLFDTPASVEHLWRFLRFCEADREWRVAEQEQRKAAAQRAHAIAQVVWTDDNNQSSAARLLGLNQSSVSRAVAASTSNAP
ncbi:hypothetical protein [Streptomyces ipomoeae]|uniref:hypothetical protein n=1 Tax=Streptomyces ipomoeae TaxID=103232 RepID=UPI001146205B|nr:hypothetical protein [Streptomyces ipomoeae]TQE33154.1 hypothetical protein Sipo7851_21930 [Streptomyces ipomoeae]